MDFSFSTGNKRYSLHQEMNFRSLQKHYQLKNSSYFHRISRAYLKFCRSRRITKIIIFLMNLFFPASIESSAGIRTKSSNRVSIPLSGVKKRIIMGSIFDALWLLVSIEIENGFSFRLDSKRWYENGPRTHKIFSFSHFFGLYFLTKLLTCYNCNGFVSGTLHFFRNI